MYSLEYLPVALKDMIEIARYISHELKNPTAADRLSEKMIKAADNLITSPYIYPAYIPIRPLEKEYRKLPVDNFVMFYWVDETVKTIIIARVIYSKRNHEELLD